MLHTVVYLFCNINWTVQWPALNAFVQGTIRALSDATMDRLRKRVGEVAAGVQIYASSLLFLFVRMIDDQAL